MKVLFFSFIFTVGIVFAADECDFSKNNLNKTNEHMLETKSSEKLDYVGNSYFPVDCCQVDGMICDQKVSENTNNKKRRASEELCQAVSDFYVTAFSKYDYKVSYGNIFCNAVSDIDSCKVIKEVLDLLNTSDEHGIKIGDELIGICRVLRSGQHDLPINNILDNFTCKIKNKFNDIYFYNNFNFLIIDNTAEIVILDNSLIILNKINLAVFYFYEGEFFYVSENGEKSYYECIVNRLQSFSTDDLTKLKKEDIKKHKIGGLVFRNLSL